MIAVLQRTHNADVTVEGEICAGISHGMVVLLCVEKNDTRSDLEYICKKIVNCRIFDDGTGRMNISIVQSGGEILLISQFTLAADCSHGNRPSYFAAAEGGFASRMMDEAKDILGGYVKVKTGVFGGHMEVRLVNDGPVTIILNSDTGKAK